MGFLNDWMFYNQGDECPESFYLWAGLSLLTTCAGHKIHYDHGDGRYRFDPKLYVCFVGHAGSGKSTAKGEVKRLVVKNFPMMQFSASIQSREDLIKKMGNEENKFFYIDKNNKKEQVYYPYYVIANELEAFLSVDPKNMTSFLVDIFDEEYYATGFKNSESQSFPNPFLSLISCATPEWFMFNLKQNLFSGGLGRRIIIIYETKKKFVANPKRPKGWEEAYKRCIHYLQQLNQPFINGQFQMSDSAKEWWTKWYEDPKWRETTNPILAQFYTSKPMQLLKVAMGFALSESFVKLTLEVEHLQAALAALNLLEPGVVKLTGNLGRNEIAPFAITIMETLERVGGYMPTAKLKGIMFKDLMRNGQEFEELTKHLKDTDKIFEVPYEDNGIKRNGLFTIPKLKETFPAVHIEWCNARGLDPATGLARNGGPFHEQT